MNIANILAILAILAAFIISETVFAAAQRGIPGHQETAGTWQRMI